MFPQIPPYIKRGPGGVYYLKHMNNISQSDEDDLKGFNFLFLAKFNLSLVIFVLVFDLLLFPIPILAKEYNNNISLNLVETEKKGIDQTLKAALNGIDYNTFPKASDLTVDWDSYFSMTAYNSEIGQTDSTPCITANGFNVCEHGIEDTVATNYLPFGTKIRIPELFGDRVFVVRDRMNQRYNKKIDIWMLSKQEAIKFGHKYAKVEILK